MSDNVQPTDTMHDILDKINLKSALVGYKINKSMVRRSFVNVNDRSICFILARNNSNDNEASDYFFAHYNSGLISLKDI